jgi:imidazoleglycerol phosphate synthase glutamine amidotransferase subunit HisH
MPPTLQEVTALLDKNAILGHIFHPKKSGINQDKTRLDLVKS